MSYDPPFVPESRKDDETLQDRVARARKAREDAADRVARRYAELEPDTRRWRVRDDLELLADKSYVR